MKSREEKEKHQNKTHQFGNNREPVQSTKIPVIEEKINIDKEVVESGKVRLTKRVHEEEKMIDTPGVHEEVDVERIAINKYVDSPPPPVRHEGDTTIISVLREVMVVEKRLELVEEVRITKRSVKSEGTQKVTLRREEVDVERIKNDTSNSDEV